MSVYYFVGGLLANNDDKVDDDWDETVVGLARVILSEKMQVRAVEDYNRRQQK